MSAIHLWTAAVLRLIRKDVDRAYNLALRFSQALHIPIDSRSCSVKVVCAVFAVGSSRVCPAVVKKYEPAYGMDHTAAHSEKIAASRAHFQGSPRSHLPRWAAANTMTFATQCSSPHT